MNRFLRILCVRLPIVLALSYVVVLGLFVAFQRSFIYHPVPAGEYTPAKFNAPFENVDLVTPDRLKLRAWWVSHRDTDTRRPALLYFHGNGGTLSNYSKVASIFYNLGWDALIFDYRGYGASDPVRDGLSESSMAIDAATAYDWLEGKVGNGRIVVWGHSLGAAIAAQIAMRRKPRGLVMEGAFTSIRDMARFRYPWLLTAPWMIADNYDNIASVRARTFPLLVMHAEQDSIIPIRFGRAVFEAAAEPKSWLVVDGIDHNDFPSVHTKYDDTLREIVRRWID